jgi:hypothetical protein
MGFTLPVVNSEGTKVVSFSRILALLMGFTLPVVNQEGTKDICSFVTNTGLATVTYEFQGGTTLDDVLFQCVDKFFIRLNSIDISDLGVNSNKDNSSSGTIIRWLGILNRKCHKLHLSGDKRHSMLDYVT